MNKLLFKHVVALDPADARRERFVPGFVAFRLCQPMLGVVFPARDVFERFPVSDGNPDLALCRFDAKVAFLLLREREHAGVHFHVAFLIFAFDGCKNDGVIRRFRGFRKLGHPANDKTCAA